MFLVAGSIRRVPNQADLSADMRIVKACLLFCTDIKIIPDVLLLISLIFPQRIS
jgi:hypothetical protein